MDTRLANEFVVASIVEMSMNIIVLQIGIRANDWTAESVIISNKATSHRITIVLIYF